MVGHKHALERAQKRDEKTKGVGLLNPEKLSPSLVISTFRRFARTPPVAEKTGQQLTDYRVIEKKKGVETEELIPQSSIDNPINTEGGSIF